MSILAQILRVLCNNLATCISSTIAKTYTRMQVISNSCKFPILQIYILLLLACTVHGFPGFNTKSPFEAIFNRSSLMKYSENDNQSQLLMCRDGLLLKAWQPQENVPTDVRILRGMCYFFALVFLIVGISLACDRFMESIEVITSKEKRIVVHKENGGKEIILVRVWNDTVANITLMALGSSAPEILLTIIEVISKNFESGELGPGTIVGSAAYNMFVIIAICIAVVPNGEVRRIKHLRVFFVTATWSIFAYVWLYLIIAQITPGRIDIWEGSVTLLFLPLTIWTAYMADRRKFLFKYFSKERQKSIRPAPFETTIESGIRRLQDSVNTKEFEEARREYIATLRELRKKYPQSDLWQLELMAHEQLVNRGSKSRAFYRQETSRKLMGPRLLFHNNPKPILVDLFDVKGDVKNVDVHIDEEEAQLHIFFEPAHYTVMESVGEFEVRVIRHGDLSFDTTVEYETVNGAAVAGRDFIPKKGVLNFARGVSEERFKIEIISNDVFEMDEHFFIRLSNPSPPAVLSTPKIATVMILDDDHSGIFSFPRGPHAISESIGIYELDVKRYFGTRGKVIVPYWTEDDTARAGEDYVEASGELLYDDNDTSKSISIEIIDNGSYEKNTMFYVNLGPPRLAPGNKLIELVQNAESKATIDQTEDDKMAILGTPKLGEVTRAQIQIVESKEFRHTVNKLALRATVQRVPRTIPPKGPYARNVAFVEPEEKEDKPSGCCFYFVHFLIILWKLLFGLIPRADMCGGYLCFFISLGYIALITAFVGDVAAHFGCTMGIKDTVTAICFVALGTSIPDTFVSKLAAVQDKYADASIGNVTGSNAVNIFLGIGTAWTMAAVYQSFHKKEFKICADTIAFSVTVFTIEAIIAIAVLLFRRSRGGELGGSIGLKYASSVIFMLLWVIYLLLSSLEAYGIIKF